MKLPTETKKSGFTIIELLTVIVIIGILSAVSFFAFSNIQSDARNTQRSSRITILSEALEKYYEKNGEYPSCATITASPSTVTSVLGGIDPDVLTSPTDTKGTNSIICSDPTTDNFGYIGGGSQYTLEYRPEGSATLVTLESRRHAIAAIYNLSIVAGIGGTVNSGGAYNSETEQTITATPNTYYSFSNWSGSVGCSGTISHTITMDANKTCTANFVVNTNTITATAGTGGTVSGGGTYNSGSTQTITANPSPYYSFNSWSGSAGCSGVASHTIFIDANKTCTASFTATAVAAPVAPVVTPSTVGATTTFSWGAASCPGNTARYQYQYTISPSGYDSGLVATASTSVALTTSTTNQTYTVATQAQCYNTATSSGWSAAGSDSYYRPLSAPTGVSATTNSSTQVTTAWTAVTGATSYNLQYDNASNFSSPAIATGITTTSKAITGLSQGVIYYFRVYALSGANSSAASASDSATTTISTPSAPSFAMSITGTATYTTSNIAPTGDWLNSSGNTNNTSYSTARITTLASTNCAAGTTPEFSYRGQYDQPTTWYGWTTWGTSQVKYMIRPLSPYGVRFQVRAHCKTAAATSAISATSQVCDWRDGGTTCTGFTN